MNQRIWKSAIMLVTILTLAVAAHGAALPGTIDLDVTLGSEASPVCRIYGDEYGDFLGGDDSNSLAFGDFNADGYDDVLIGCYEADVRSWNQIGETMIIYGGSSLPGTSINLDTDGYLSEWGETRIIGVENPEQFGFSVAAGDVNGDGYDDAIVCANFGNSLKGRVYIVFGSSTLPMMNYDLRPGVITGNETWIEKNDGGNFRLGHSLAIGDLNGDGYDDIVLSDPYYCSSTKDYVGEAYIVFGSSDITGKNLDIGGSHPGATYILGDDEWDNIGYSVACGDVNGDGYDDALIGAMSKDPAGEVYVIYGNSAIKGKTIDLDTDGSISGEGETRIRGDDSNDWFSYSMDTGDVDADGYDDIVIGAIKADPPGGSDAGEVYVVYGGSTLPASIVNLDTNGAISTYGETRILGDDSEDYAGFAVSCGDVNGDGYDDVVIGAPQADPGSRDMAGETYLIYGSPSIAASIIDLNPDLSGVDVALLGDDSDDKLGSSVAAGGDMDCDGWGEFAANCPFAHSPFLEDSYLNETGMVVNVFGDGTSPTAAVKEFFLPGNAPWRGMGGYLSPVVRSWAGFTGGDDGSGGASQLIARIRRDDAEISGLGIGDNSDVADVMWTLSTNRTGYTADLCFQYTDTEISGLDELDLRLYRAPGSSGPWSLVPGQTMRADSNEIVAPVSSLGCFAIADAGSPTPPTPGIALTVADPVDFGERSANQGESRPFRVTITNNGENDSTLNITQIGTSLPGIFIAHPSFPGTDVLVRPICEDWDECSSTTILESFITDPIPGDRYRCHYNVNEYAPEKMKVDFDGRFGSMALIKEYTDCYYGGGGEFYIDLPDMRVGDFNSITMKFDFIMDALEPESQGQLRFTLTDPDVPGIFHYSGYQITVWHKSDRNPFEVDVIEESASGGISYGPKYSLQTGKIYSVCVTFTPGESEGMDIITIHTVITRDDEVIKDHSYPLIVSFEDYVIKRAAFLVCCPFQGAVDNVIVETRSEVNGVSLHRDSRGNSDRLDLFLSFDPSAGQGGKGGMRYATRSYAEFLWIYHDGPGGIATVDLEGEEILPPGPTAVQPAFWSLYE